MINIWQLEYNSGNMQFLERTTRTIQPKLIKIQLKLISMMNQYITHQLSYKNYYQNQNCLQISEDIAHSNRMSYLAKPTIRRRHSSLFQRMECEINKISKQLNASNRHKYKPSVAFQSNCPESNTLLIDRNLTDNKNPNEGHYYIQTDFKQNQNINPIRYSKVIDYSNSQTKRSKHNQLNSTLTRRKRHSNLNNLHSYYKNEQEVQIGQGFQQNTAKFTHKLNGPQQYQHQESKQYQRTKNSYKDRYILQPKTMKLRSNSESQVLKLIQQNNVLSKYLGKLQQIQEQSNYKYQFLKSCLAQKSQRIQNQKILAMKENIYAKKLVEHYKMKSEKYKRMLVQMSGNAQHSNEQSPYQAQNKGLVSKESKPIGQSGRQQTKKSSFKLQLESSSSRKG